MTKQRKDNIADDAQESLVQALESIKGLLEKSENKLSAARESIALANDSSQKAKISLDDETIPVLNDVVIPDASEKAQPDLNLFETSTPIEPEPVTEAAQLIPQGIPCDDVIDLVDEFQDRIKPMLNEAITSSSILNLEEVLNKALEKELHQLRNEIKQLDN